MQCRTEWSSVLFEIGVSAVPALKATQHTPAAIVLVTIQMMMTTMVSDAYRPLDSTVPYMKMMTPGKSEIDCGVPFQKSCFKTSGLKSYEFKTYVLKTYLYKSFVSKIEPQN